jgi:hypothetical protein
VSTVYENFLRLTGFQDDEISQYVPVWRRASEILGLTEDDVRFATEEWIPQHYDIALEGIRKLLGCYVKEAIEISKANEYKRQGVKIVYGILPAINHYYYALKSTAPDRVFVSFPDIMLLQILNGLFHNITPYLQEAEKGGISYGCRHCALNKTRYAMRMRALSPSPDVSWIWGFVCDEGPKTDEFIRIQCDPGWKSYITRLPHDQPAGTEEDLVDYRVEYLANQMRDGFEFVQKEIGIQVSDEKIVEVSNTWQRYASKVAELCRLMASDPQPLGGEDLTWFCEVLGRPFNIGIEPIEAALDITIREVKQRVANEEGILPKGAPKLMAYFISCAVPWVAKLFEGNGVGLTYIEALMPSKRQLEPYRFQDPYMAAAETWLRFSYAVNIGYKANVMCEKVETYGVDGLVFGFMDFDRWLGSDNRLLAKMISERTKVPIFYIEGDLFDDRDYSPEALRTRIESICEIVKMRKK